MPRLKFTLAYVGTAYHGWQTQRRKSLPELPTIQSTLEKVIASIIGKPVRVCGAGRTDAGVHAEGQVAHVDIPESKLKLDWQLVLNASLPKDIRVVHSLYVEDTFHAQHDAVQKLYAYRLWLNHRYTPPVLYPFVWSCGRLDLEAMDKASTFLLGTHNFVSLQNRGTKLLSTVRTISALYREPSQFFSLNESHEVTWFFKADGFLKQMVRNIMGLLVLVGRRKIQPEKIPYILEAKDRRHSAPTAPAHGLTLKKVFYS
ncbi:tRNA pseudouridine(38-40) synthase TruA [Lawsonia intracellularis]|uniref:tRNA pseudouridine(38-40) synthase TruA n=1 Tax=Lawsonia intracellularis TaxID=29546 RepID=UPI0009779F17|nr:tRNA pseudouridine(38-40) synthase TruA [Lawsonia intracellularis]KAA0204516.1 tRNA pseudouridine(38-40) synthase TruA [Lawsonia intracellularis]OMQ02305.1 tRNA pseudouridine(38-40) synthase TruA [Lawsonia intracellularis]RBN35279.1 tRNA pseudouridine(38-40) synthase TruA [Lawsonia intracellularis]RBN35461.1 tRNA pseudouridine(38-40) synthase TruA [Lawsonia intracellularis]UYH52806.1 tRNA pseudouridine(38-40) synthase TruA [Lawsonia intracellularis]